MHLATGVNQYLPVLFGKVSNGQSLLSKCRHGEIETANKQEEMGREKEPLLLAH